MYACLLEIAADLTLSLTRGWPPTSIQVLVNYIATYPAIVKTWKDNVAISQPSSLNNG